MSIPYPKIETLLDRDESFQVVEGKWRLPEFEYLKSNIWLYTEKVDGTNIRVMWDGATVKFAGRSDDAQMPPFLLRRLGELLPPTKFLSSQMPPCTLYGEGYGAKIQKGGGNYKKDGQDFALFDVLIEKWWLERENVENVAEKLGLKAVPLVETGDLVKAIHMVRMGLVSSWGPFNMEGLVVRPAITLFTRKGERLLGKIKTKDFKVGK